MNTDFLPRTLTVAAAALFALSQAAAALTIDLGGRREGEPMSLDVSRTDTNRIELPETVINAFSSNEAMDVKIIGRSVLVRTEDQAELIILTEKRRLTLLLSPEQGPSRTAIIRDKDTQPPDPDTDAAGGTQALPYERAITDLVVSLAKDTSPAVRDGEQKLSRSLRIARGAEAAAPPFFAALYVVRNSGSRTVALEESMFLDSPETVAVGMERVDLGPGDAGRVFVVMKKESPR